MAVETIRWQGPCPGGHVALIEQTLLPGRAEIAAIHTLAEMIAAIRRLAVRGAPAIGVAAGYGLVLALQELGEAPTERFRERLSSAKAELAAARPTAVNLAWALARTAGKVECMPLDTPSPALLAALFSEAGAIASEDAAQCRRMGELGAELIADGSSVLTHCNAGALATGGIGTALAPIYVAVERGKRVHVWADETRPLLQGARLTAWELSEAGIEVTLITDSMAAACLASGRIDAVFVGSDRIARNGDVCNKIGTYGVAVLARRHAVPFYVVAPLSTFDPDVPDGASIPIEERAPEEVTEGFGPRTAPAGVGVWNPAFDVTPAELVTAIVTERGILEGPDRAKVEALLRDAGRI